MKILAFKNPSGNYQRLKVEIDDSKPCVNHVHRGDYTENHATFDLLPKSYYQQVIDYVIKNSLLIN